MWGEEVKNNGTFFLFFLFSSSYFWNLLIFKHQNYLIQHEYESRLGLVTDMRKD
jgi:hypothetical protein